MTTPRDRSAPASSVAITTGWRIRIGAALACGLTLVPPLTAQQSSDTTAHAPAPAPGAPPPAFIRVPGTGIAFLIGGYLKADAIQDFSPLGDRYEFRVRTVPVTGTTNAQGGQTTFHARETRLNLDVRSGEGPSRLRLFAETDFFGDNNTLRLRHAFGEYGRLLAGQTWSTFMDISVRPRSLDFEGPEGEIFVRQGLVRWTQPVGAHWRWALALENPNAAFNIPAGRTGTVRSTLPDLPGFIRYETRRWHAQLAGLVHQVRYDGGNGEANTAVLGWGVSATARTKLSGESALMGQVGVGKGSASYFDSFAGQKLDAVFASTGVLTPLGMRGGLLAYEHGWNPTLRSLLGYSRAEISPNALLPGDALRRVQDVRANLVWSPSRLVDYGTEVLWGRRENQNGGLGAAWRVQVSFIYHVN